MAPRIDNIVAWNVAGWVLNAAHVAGGKDARKLRKRAKTLRVRLEPAAMAEARAVREGR